MFQSFKSVVSVSLLALTAFSLVACSANLPLSPQGALPAPNRVGSFAAPNAVGAAKTLTFRTPAVRGADPNFNPAPREFSVALRALPRGAADNHVQTYMVLSSAVEALANMAVSTPMTDGSDNYDNAKLIDEYTKRTNLKIEDLSATEELKLVHYTIRVLRNTYSRSTWSSKFSVKYVDVKVFNALTYKFLIDNFDGEKFYLTPQKVANHFSQLGMFCQEFDDASYYMYDALNTLIELYPTSLDFMKQQLRPNGESWQVYATRLRQQLIQISNLKALG
jgi:hypothetical protein